MRDQTATAPNAFWPHAALLSNKTQVVKYRHTCVRPVSTLVFIDNKENGVESTAGMTSTMMALPSLDTLHRGIPHSKDTWCESKDDSIEHRRWDWLGQREIRDQ